MKRISFNVPPFAGREFEYIKDAIDVQKKISGDGKYTKLCSEYMEKMYRVKRALLTTSCSHALDMSAIVTDIKEGDEVILPSYTFVSTANAFVLRGAKVVFVDIKPETMNINEKLIESAITERTKAIVPVHYAGVGCEMDEIMGIAKKHNLYVIEDAAQGVISKYKGKYLGTIGDLGAYSFHETKNYTCGEGGALLINNPEFLEISEIVREKGTNRARFFRGEVDKYTWVEKGSSYLPSEINAAFLYAQLEEAEKIDFNRIRSWRRYYKNLKQLRNMGFIDLPYVPDHCEHNAHMFYIKLKNLEERTKFMEAMKNRGIGAVFHYVPLHSSPAGLKYGRFHGEDIYTTKESDRLVRLPIYYNLKDEDITYIIKSVYEFFGQVIKDVELIS